MIDITKRKKLSKMVLYVLSLYFTIKAQMPKAGTLQSHIITISQNYCQFIYLKTTEK